MNIEKHMTSDETQVKSHEKKMKFIRTQAIEKLMKLNDKFMRSNKKHMKSIEGHMTSIGKLVRPT